jgi:hypothetical protein
MSAPRIGRDGSITWNDKEGRLRVDIPSDNPHRDAPLALRDAAEIAPRARWTLIEHDGNMGMAAAIVGAMPGKPDVLMRIHSSQGFLQVAREIFAYCNEGIGPQP